MQKLELKSQKVGIVTRATGKAREAHRLEIRKGILANIRAQILKRERELVDLIDSVVLHFSCYFFSSIIFIFINI